MKKNIRPCILQIPCLLALASTSFGAVQITDLGTLGGTESFASGINDHGQVVGFSRLPGDQDIHMFLYDHGILMDLSSIYNIGSGTYDVTVGNINNSGQIVGNSPQGHVMILDGGTITEIGVFNGVPSPFSVGTSNNNLGQVVGYYSSPTISYHHAFLYSNGIVTSLGPFGPNAISVASAINDSGMITGVATDSFMVPAHAFLYNNGVMKDISPFGSSESYGSDINSSGQIVGTFLTADHTSFHAFLYSDGVFTDLGFEGSPNTYAYAINDQGQVLGITYVNYFAVCYNSITGEDYPCPTEPRSFLYDHGRITGLQLLLRRAGITDWESVSAIDINNNGQIVGTGLHNHKYRAFLLEISNTR